MCDKKDEADIKASQAEDTVMRPTSPQRPIDPMTTPLDDMTIGELTGCLRELRVRYANAVNGWNIEVAKLRVKISEKDFELATKGLTIARQDLDALLGLREEK
jgi:hypothetical protein